MRSTDLENTDAKEFAQIRADMKAFLKQQSKNDLIKMIFEQLDLYIQLRREFKALNEQKETPDEAVPSSNSVNG